MLVDGSGNLKMTKVRSGQALQWYSCLLDLSTQDGKVLLSEMQIQVSAHMIERPQCAPDRAQQQ